MEESRPSSWDGFHQVWEDCWVSDGYFMAISWSKMMGIFWTPSGGFRKYRGSPGHHPTVRLGFSLTIQRAYGRYLLWKPPCLKMGYIPTHGHSMGKMMVQPGMLGESHMWAIHPGWWVAIENYTIQLIGHYERASPIFGNTYQVMPSSLAKLESELGQLFMGNSYIGL